MDNSAQQQNTQPQPPAPEMPAGPQTPQPKNRTIAIVIISVVAFLLLAGGAVAIIWLVLSSQRNLQSSTTSSSTTAGSNSSSTSNNTQSGSQTSGFVTIEEFGVKYKKTNSQKNLSYKVTDSTPGIRYAVFTSSVAGSKCATAPEVGKIIQTNFELDAATAADAGVSQVKIGDYWYMYGIPVVSTCDALTSDPTLKAAYDNEVAILKNEIFASLAQK